ncbi:MAG: hypothetical protein RIT27_2213 [Pseudomonadota bacterium]|jgi:putative phosphoesterase
MKICILSDSHDHIPLLCACVKQAKEKGAEAILHCGDIVAPSTLGKLKPFELPIYAIHGNNSGDLFFLSKLAHESSFIHYYGQDAALTLAKRRIFLVHYPHYARAMAATGDYDLVCCGHTHRAMIEQIPNMKGKTTIVCNAGTVGGVGAVPTYIFGDLETLEFNICNVE